MQNLELKARVTKVYPSLVDVNTFKYKLVDIEAGGITHFKALISLFADVDVGDCFSTTTWKVTRLGETEHPVDICIRIDKLTLLDPDDFEPSEYINGIVYGTYVRSEKCFLRTVGPDKKPFMYATIKLEDSNKEVYGMLLVAFNAIAKRLSTVKSRTQLKCTVSIKKRKKGDGYEFALLSFEEI